MWFSVRHILKNEPAYEERITIWDAEHFEAALALGRAEAQNYANTLHNGVVLPYFEVFRLFEDPVYGAADLVPVAGGEAFSAAHGAEVFSLIRESHLGPNEYIEQFFDTGDELESSRMRSWHTD